jgi:hypothetical protein
LYGVLSVSTRSSAAKNAGSLAKRDMELVGRDSVELGTADRSQ